MNPKNVALSIILVASAIYAACSRFEVQKDDEEVKSGPTKKSDFEGYWLLAQRNYTKDGREIRDIMTVDTTLALGAINGKINGVNPADGTFYCDHDRLYDVINGFRLFAAATEKCPAINISVYFLDDEAHFLTSDANGKPSELVYVKKTKEQVARILKGRDKLSKTYAQGIDSPIFSDLIDK